MRSEVKVVEIGLGGDGVGNALQCLKVLTPKP